MGTKVFGEAPITDVAQELKRQTAALHNGDMTRAESMLLAQAHTLDGLFATLTNRALNAKHMEQLETYMRLALKAQSQSRATLQTLGELKSPKNVAFVRQANIGQNVQVNNGTTEPTRPRQKKKAQNELLEAEHGEWLDTRATCTPSRDDSKLEAVGQKHRPEKRRR
ncbi:hypothetical protein [Pseudomonas luteola]|uniref:hypothetical protein n=2 Tax=Pseudomonas TaxID=286 RepID=UPI00289730F4|nr:hypothetical protein [Pseudomonas luteola]